METFNDLGGIFQRKLILFCR